MLKKLFKKFFIICLIFTGFILSNRQIYANDSFEIKLDSEYLVTEDGNTQVSHNFKIKNLTPLTYVKQYGLKLSSNRINNVKVYSNNQEINPEVVNTNNQTSIGIDFTDEVVGQGKTREFKLIYNDPDIAQISGIVLEVNIPELANPEEFTSHNINLITPSKYGRPTRAQPENFEVSFNYNDTSQLYTIFNNLSGKSISALFGEFQIFHLNLKYNLENPSDTARLIQIALPPDTAFQKLNYQSLEPKPESIEADSDGNWIATYQLEPNTASVIQAELLAKVSLEANPNYPNPEATSFHTRSSKYWPSDSRTIVSLANNLHDLEQINQEVINKLNYDFDFGLLETNRFGAVKALENPNQALCQEFTDLFITLARAKQIPARRLTGYAYTENSVLKPLSLEQDVLHAWPEYFDGEKNLWIQADPTWEKTSGGIDYFHQFDLNHITFAINGKSDELPYAAGSYKAADSNSKDVEVEFAEQFPSQNPKFKFAFKQKNILGWPVPNSAYLEINNQSGQAFYHQSLPISGQEDILIKSILPFEKKQLKLNLTSNNNWPQKFNLNINFNDQNYQYSAIKEPQIYQQLQNPYLWLGVGAGFVSLALGAGSILVFVKKRQSALRRQSQKSQQTP